MTYNDGWDDAPVAGTPNQPTQEPDQQPATEGWDVEETAGQVDPVTAGYQMLAADPEEIDIAAQRAANRGSRPVYGETDNEGWDVEAPVAIPGAVSPQSATSTLPVDASNDEDWDTPSEPSVVPPVYGNTTLPQVETPVQQVPVTPVVEVPAVQVPVTQTAGETLPVERETVSTVPPVQVAPEESVIPGVPVPPSSPVPPVAVPPVQVAPAPGLPAWAAVTQDNGGEDYNDGWDDAPIANPGARVVVDEEVPAPFVPPVQVAPVAPQGTPVVGIPFGTAAGAAVPLPPAPAPVERKVAVPVPGDSIDDDPDEDFGDDSDVITPAHGAVIPPVPQMPNANQEDPAAGKGKAGSKKKSKSKALGGIRLTARDMQIMAFLARYRTATVGQMARKFQTSETALRNRLPLLDKAGLITWAWAAQTKPKIWMITEQGLQTVNMSLTAPTVRWGQLRHTLGLVDLGTTFELAGEIVLTEREIRAAATRYTPTARLKSAIDLTRFQSGLEPLPIDGLDPNGAMKRVKDALVVPVPGRTIGHIPDMVLARQPFPNGSSGNIAIELELTRKGLTEWKTVLTAYKDSPAFAQVYYFVMSGEVQRGLQGVIKSLGLEDKVFVEKFVPLDLTADPTVTGGGA